MQKNQQLGSITLINTWNHKFRIFGIAFILTVIGVGLMVFKGDPKEPPNPSKSLKFWIHWSFLGINSEKCRWFCRYGFFLLRQKQDSLGNLSRNERGFTISGHFFNSTSEWRSLSSQCLPKPTNPESNTSSTHFSKVPTLFKLTWDAVKCHPFHWVLIHLLSHRTSQSSPKSAKLSASSMLLSCTKANMKLLI